MRLCAREPTAPTAVTSSEQRAARDACLTEAQARSCGLAAPAYLPTRPGDVRSRVKTTP